MKVLTSRVCYQVMRNVIQGDGEGWLRSEDWVFKQRCTEILMSWGWMMLICLFFDFCWRFVRSLVFFFFFGLFWEVFCKVASCWVLILSHWNLVELRLWDYWSSSLWLFEFLDMTDDVEILLLSGSKIKWFGVKLSHQEFHLFPVHFLHWLNCFMTVTLEQVVFVKIIFVGFCFDLCSEFLIFKAFGQLKV